MDGISHVSFTPATDFVDAANVWNSVSSSWWDFTRDDTRGDIDIGARSFGLLSVTLAKTYIIATEDTMTFAIVDFNIWKDFRDINVSPAGGLTTMNLWQFMKLGMLQAFVVILAHQALQ